MGCNQSKQVSTDQPPPTPPKQAVPPQQNGVGIGVPPTESPQSNQPNQPKIRPTTRRTSSNDSIPPTVPHRALSKTASIRDNGVKTTKDGAWSRIWESQQQNIVDPFDVHAVLNDCMACQINKLASTEITLLQRRIRQVVAALPKSNPQLSTHKMMNRFINGTSKQNDEQLESKSVVEKYHQLDELTFKRIFAAGDSLEGNLASIDPLSSLYTLGTYLSSDYVWDRTAAIAMDSAERAGLVLDVNKKDTSIIMPSPVSLKEYLPQEPLEVVGTNFSSLAFLVSLALRKLLLQEEKKIYISTSRSFCI